MALASGEPTAIEMAYDIKEMGVAAVEELALIYLTYWQRGARATTKQIEEFMARTSEDITNPSMVEFLKFIKRAWSDEFGRLARGIDDLILSMMPSLEAAISYLRKYVVFNYYTFQTTILSLYGEDLIKSDISRLLGPERSRASLPLSLPLDSVKIPSELFPIFNVDSNLGGREEHLWYVTHMNLVIGLYLRFIGLLLPVGDAIVRLCGYFARVPLEEYLANGKVSAFQLLSGEIFNNWECPEKIHRLLSEFAMDLIVTGMLRVPFFEISNFEEKEISRDLPHQ